MKIPLGFQFNQSNLQDFVDCPRRFQLKALLNIAWPAVEAGPSLENELYLHLGSVFHHLVRQHQSGLPAERLAASILHQQGSSDGELQQWWDNYQTALLNNGNLAIIQSPNVQHFTEISFSIPLGGYRLVAKYDLLILDPSGRMIIFDWKTNRKHPRRSWLLDRIQTRVYPYLLVKSPSVSDRIKQISPEQVEMCYWFANFPTDSENIMYSQEQFEADELYILRLIKRISQQADDIFPLTHADRHCKYCVYRSLCDRGIQAGNIDDSNITNDDDANGLKLDYEQIDEIEY